MFVDATRAGGATVVAAYSPRIRPGATVSFPLAWDDLDRADPTDFTIRTVPALLGDGNPWAEAMPARRRCPTRSSRRGVRSPSPASPRCTRASGAHGRSAGRLLAERQWGYYHCLQISGDPTNTNPSCVRQP